MIEEITLEVFKKTFESLKTTNDYTNIERRDKIFHIIDDLDLYEHLFAFWMKEIRPYFVFNADHPDYVVGLIHTDFAEDKINIFPFGLNINNEKVYFSWKNRNPHNLFTLQFSAPAAPSVTVASYNAPTLKANNCDTAISISNPVEDRINRIEAKQNEIDKKLDEILKKLNG